MDRERYEQIIAEQAADIKKKPQESTLYGHPVNMENMDEVIVAVWYLSELKFYRA